MTERSEKPRRKPRMVLPPTSGDWYALQRRYEGTAYCDEERFTTIEEAIAAFQQACRRTPKHDLRIRRHVTVAEWRPGQQPYFHGLEGVPYDFMPEVVGDLPPDERSH